MKPSKKLFFDVLKLVSVDCAQEGFVQHPAYKSAWEPVNQAYEATLIQSNVEHFIDQFNVAFSPTERAFRFNIVRSRNSFGINAIEDIPIDAREWSNRWLYEPFDEYLLHSGSAWNVFSTKNHFKLRRRFANKMDLETRRISSAFRRNSKYLFDALHGEYSGRLVRVTHHNLERPD